MDENTKKRLDQQFAFIREIDREKFIGRQTYLSDGRRKENDAEHAWHMAIMTMLLSEYANEPIDVLHTIGMLLIHDLVEIDFEKEVTSMMALSLPSNSVIILFLFLLIQYGCTVRTSGCPDINFRITEWTFFCCRFRLFFLHTC